MTDVDDGTNGLFPAVLLRLLTIDKICLFASLKFENSVLIYILKKTAY